MSEAVVFSLPSNRYAVGVVLVDSLSGEPVVLGAGTAGGEAPSVGNVSIDPADLVALASAANQAALLDRFVREGARTQNILAQVSENAATVRVLSFSRMDSYVSTDAQSGVAVNDRVLHITDYTVSEIDTGNYWTTPGTQRWVRIFNSGTNQHINELLPSPLDTSFATQDDSGVAIKTTFSRTLTRRVVDESLTESLQAVTETRTVQASHIYPYPSIFDSGWV